MPPNTTKCHKHQYYRHTSQATSSLLQAWPIDLIIIKVEALLPSGDEWMEAETGVTITDMVVVMVEVAVVEVVVEVEVVVGRHTWDRLVT